MPVKKFTAANVRLHKTAHHCLTRQELVFGTLYEFPDFQPQMFNSILLEQSHPEVATNLEQHGKDIPQLPSDWLVEVSWIGMDLLDTTTGSGMSSSSTFVSYELIVPMEILGVRDAKRIPQEVGQLIAAHLINGQTINFRDFEKRRNQRDLVYLPFVLTGKGVRFFVYDPSTDRIIQAIQTLKQVIAQLNPIKASLAEILKRAYALIRLDEISTIDSESIAPALRGIRTSLAARLHGHKKHYGFTYQNMPGSQSVILV
ncbi:MAG: hypothetical protein V1838_00145 [Patescibacteria group bacterium]